MSERQLRFILMAAVLVLMALRLVFAGRMELLPEEAYYWTYAKNPALGYYDHPPMVAWTVAVGTALLGDNEWGVRFINTLLWVSTGLMLLVTARMWFGNRVALLATLLFALAPIFVGIQMIVTPDGPLIFFWSLALLAITRALFTHRSWWWLLAGVAFGGALLSKYYALLLAPSLLVFLLLSAKHRFWLARPQPWIALMLALAVFSPVIVWNAQHQWASFLYQSTRATRHGNPAMQFAEFWAIQIGILTPLLFAMAMFAAARAVKRGWLQRLDQWNFVASFSVPLFLLFTVESLKTEIHVNWTAPVFLTLMMATAATFLECVDSAELRQRAGLWRSAAWLTFVLCVVVMALGHSSVAVGKPEMLAYRRARGWREIAGQVRAALCELESAPGPKPFVLGADRYNIAAELGFYLGKPHECVNEYALGEQGLGYRYWADLAQFEGRPAVVVLSSIRKNTWAQLGAHFDKVGDARKVTAFSNGRPWREVHMVICYGYHKQTRAEP